MHTSSNQKFIGSVVLAVALLAVIGGFYLTETSTASKAELAYAEHSLLGKQAGAVIPASCDSVPPFSHFANDCSQMCALSGNPDVKNNTEYSPASNSCVCKNGKTNPPNCTLPETEIAFRQSVDDGSQIDYFAMTFKTSATAASMGQNVNLSWEASGKGITCTASNNWSGEKGRKGSLNVTYERSECRRIFSAKYTLTCSNKSGNTRAESVYVTYTNPSYDLCECNPSHKMCRM